MNRCMSVLCAYLLYLSRVQCKLVENKIQGQRKSTEFNLAIRYAGESISSLRTPALGLPDARSRSPRSIGHHTDPTAPARYWSTDRLPPLRSRHACCSAIAPHASHLANIAQTARTYHTSAALGTQVTGTASTSCGPLPPRSWRGLICDFPCFRPFSL